MWIRYDGPAPSVNVGGHGEHLQGQVMEYPDDFGAELLETSRRQKFERVDVDDDAVIAETPPIDEMTVAQLKDLLAKLGLGVPVNAKKADLVALVLEATSPPPVAG